MAALANLLAGLLELFDEAGKQSLLSSFAREFERQLREADLAAYLRSVGFETAETASLTPATIEGLSSTLGLYLEHFDKLPNVDVSPKPLLALTLQQQPTTEAVLRCVCLCEQAASLRPTLVLVLAHKLYQEDLCDPIQDAVYQAILVLCRHMDAPDASLKLAFLDYLLSKGKDLQSLKACQDFTRLLLEEAPLEYATRLLDFGYAEEAVRALCRLLDLNRQLALQFASSSAEDPKQKSGIFVDVQAAGRVDSADRSSTRKPCSRTASTRGSASDWTGCWRSWSAATTSTRTTTPKRKTSARVINSLLKAETRREESVFLLMRGNLVSNSRTLPFGLLVRVRLFWCAPCRLHVSFLRIGEHV